MDVDDAAQQPPPRRPSAVHDRPVRAPVGPRRPKAVPDSPDPAPDSPAADHPPASYADAHVQAPSTPQKPVPATFVAPPPLVPPPAIAFESVPIPWKGLPLEAAQWTFSSEELQEIVSKAIRLSARDSFVRLLSLQAVEVDIVRESDRLEASRLEAQAKWRFEAGRRTMYMQALNACAAFAQGTGPELGDAGSPIAAFVGQLASAIASCDSLLSTILRISDQQSQIALIQHQHWSSALGMALRKLSKAHERQGQDLKRAQARVQTLEDELEEAWREAEKMAIEFDDLEQEIAESEGSVIIEPEDLVGPRPDLQFKHDLDETGTLGDVTIQTDIAVVLGVTATAVASKATLVTSNPGPARPVSVDKSDARSVRSAKSIRSKRSTRDVSHLARLNSARTRSRAASNASLRLPKSLRSTPAGLASPVDAPPIPALPPVSVPCDSFLDMDNVPQEHVRKLPPKRQEPTVTLPTPPHSAGLPATHVPSIWLEPDDAKPARLSTLDRAHSLQIFSSLTPSKMRRSNLVMSLTGSDRSSDDARKGSRSRSVSGSSGEHQAGGVAQAEARPTMETGTGTSSPSPTSAHSPASLPTLALTHFRGPSLSSSSHSAAAADAARAKSKGKGKGKGKGAGTGASTSRPGSAGARLTTTNEDKVRARTASTGAQRSLVSRASSVILRRLSQATVGAGKMSPGRGVGGGRVTAMGSPSRSRHGRTVVERVREDDELECGGGSREGEVMLIGSPHADVSDVP